MTESTCNCGKPMRDDRHVCDDCLDGLSRALGDVTWLDSELETTITKRKGVDYRRVGGGKGAKTAPRGDKRIPGDMSEHATTMDTPDLGAHIQGDPMDMSAAEAREHLRGVLVAWTRFCAEEQVRNQSPHQGIPADTLPAISRWLLWRVDGLALLDIGAEAVDEITSAVAHCHRLIDRPADKLYAGRCGAEVEEGVCETDLYAAPGEPTIKCRTCGQHWDVKERRAFLLGEAEEVLATAVEISRAVSWLGAEPLTADRVRQWASRGRLLARGHVTEEGKTRPTYRVGDAIDLLSATTKSA